MKTIGEPRLSVRCSGNRQRRGRNNFLITHKPNIIDTLGKEWFDVREGRGFDFDPKTAHTAWSRESKWKTWPARDRYDIKIALAVPWRLAVSRRPGCSPYARSRSLSHQ